MENRDRGLPESIGWSLKFLLLFLKVGLTSAVLVKKLPQGAKSGRAAAAVLMEEQNEYSFLHWRRTSSS